MAPSRVNTILDKAEKILDEAVDAISPEERRSRTELANAYIALAEVRRY